MILDYLFYSLYSHLAHTGDMHVPAVYAYSTFLIGSWQYTYNVMDMFVCTAVLCHMSG